jgi:hypothetical protein
MNPTLQQPRIDGADSPQNRTDPLRLLTLFSSKARQPASPKREPSVKIQQLDGRLRRINGLSSPGQSPNPNPQQTSQ